MAELEDTTGVELFQGRDSGKARSMIAIKAEKIQRAKYVISHDCYVANFHDIAQCPCINLSVSIIYLAMSGGGANLYCTPFSIIKCRASQQMILVTRCDVGMADHKLLYSNCACAYSHISNMRVIKWCLCRTYKRVMEEAGMLGSFIRLVDYMLVEALVDRTVGTVEELVAMLEAPRASADKTHKVPPCTMLWLDILGF
jgi:hypothetical protein